MKIINIYNSFFIIIIFLALYGFVYERTLYDITYGKYVQNYFDAGNSLPSYGNVPSYAFLFPSNLP